MKKYALHPGYARSLDGNTHFISVPKLAACYGLNYRECVAWDNRNSAKLLGLKFSDYIHLYPRNDGEYVLIRSEE